MKRILVARFGAIGDVLMATPTLRALARAYPDAQITHILAKGLGDVLTGIDYLHDVIEFDKRTDQSVGGAVQLARRLRAERFDLYVNLQDSVRARAVGWASGAKRTLVYRKRDGVQPETGREVHAIDNYLETLRPLGIAPAACDRHLDFFVPGAARATVDALLSEVGVGVDEPLLLVVPGASVPSRQWPPERLAAFLDLLPSRLPGVRVALAGAGGDRAVADAARPLTRPDAWPIDLIGRTRMKETGALFQRADAIVSMNTGPLHLAAAVGAPLVTLFGAWSEDRTGPAPPPPNARRRELPIVLSRTEGLDCAPCMSRTCKRGDLACLLRIEPDAVLDAVVRQLAQRGR